MTIKKLNAILAAFPLLVFLIILCVAYLYSDNQMSSFLVERSTVDMNSRLGGDVAFFVSTHSLEAIVLRIVLGPFLLFFPFNISLAYTPSALLLTLDTSFLLLWPAFLKMLWPALMEKVGFGRGFFHYYVKIFLLLFWPVAALIAVLVNSFTAYARYSIPLAIVVSLLSIDLAKSCSSRSPHCSIGDGSSVSV